MKTYQNLLVSALALPLSVLCPIQLQPTQAEPVPIITIDDVSVQEMVRCISGGFKVNSKEITTVIHMESGFNQKAVHDGGLGVGVTGFHKDTFDRWNKQSGLNLEYTRTSDQITLMAWAFTQGNHYKDDWTTWQRLHKKGLY